jgi:HlyD family secretion protein
VIALLRPVRVLRLGPLVAGAVLACGGEGSGGGAGETVRVERRTFASTVIAIGSVQPQIGAEVRVGARVSGRVRRLVANIGDRVERGQVIAELETEDLDAIVAQRRAEAEAAESRRMALERRLPDQIAAARAEVASREAMLRQAGEELTRQTSLMRERATSQATLEMAQQVHDVAAAQLEVARRAQQVLEGGADDQRAEAASAAAAAGAALRAAEVERSFTRITAPISGVVASVATQEGETVAAGLNAPTFVTIVDLARLQVNAYVDEVDIGKIVVGQGAFFTVDAFPARDFEGRVTAIYPTATIQDNVVKYVVALEVQGDSTDVLRPEMTATVRIALESRSALAVPTRAIRRDGGQSVVFLHTGRTTEHRVVRLGWRDGPWAEVVEGLNEGDEILADPPAITGGNR